MGEADGEETHGCWFLASVWILSVARYLVWLLGNAVLGVLDMRYLNWICNVRFVGWHVFHRYNIDETLWFLTCIFEIIQQIDRTSIQNRMLEKTPHLHDLTPYDYGMTDLRKNTGFMDTHTRPVVFSHGATQKLSTNTPSHPTTRAKLWPHF